MLVYRTSKASTLEYKYNTHLHSDMHCMMPITFVSNDDRHLAIVPHSYVTQILMQAYVIKHSLSHVQIYGDDNQSLV